MPRLGGSEGASGGAVDPEAVPGFQAGRVDPFAGPFSLLGTVRKDAKAERCKWPLRVTACIEDPFESSYDVAHVLRASTWAAIRAEFVRAYAVLVAVPDVGRGTVGGAAGRRRAQALVHCIAFPARRHPRESLPSARRALGLVGG